MTPKRIKFALLGVLAVIATFVWIVEVHRYLSLDHFIYGVNKIRSNPWAPLIFVLTYAVCCLFAPISPFPVAGGVLFGFWHGLILNAIGSNAGAITAFAIARVFRKKIRPHFPSTRIHDVDRRLHENGLFAMISMRILGFPPFQFLNYICGLSSVRLRHYVLGTFLGMLPWKITVTYFSHTLWLALIESGEAGFYAASRKLLLPISGVFVCVAGIISLTAYMKKKSSQDNGNQPE
jgi:uncharacterized membrane protein YdjX (TVP38/TMEM64 family)